MGDVINLRRARKAKAKADAEAKAAENRAKFGRSKADRMKVESTETQRIARLEAHRRDPSPTDDQ